MPEPKPDGTWTRNASPERVKLNRVNAKARGRAYRRLAEYNPRKFAEFLEEEKLIARSEEGLGPRQGA